jgi:hypothetical protein
MFREQSQLRSCRACYYDPAHVATAVRVFHNAFGPTDPRNPTVLMEFSTDRDDTDVAPPQAPTRLSAWVCVDREVHQLHHSSADELAFSARGPSSLLDIGRGGNARLSNHSGASMSGWVECGRRQNSRGCGLLVVATQSVA